MRFIIYGIALFVFIKIRFLEAKPMLCCDFLK